MPRTGRPKATRSTMALNWRIPVELVEWGRERAAVKGMEPGEWLTHVLDQVRAGGAVQPEKRQPVVRADPGQRQVVTRFKETKR